MSDNLWGCPCCGHSGSERAEINKLTSRVAELELSLDDRDCYIADADMKNEELTKQVAELRAVVYEANKYLDINNLTTIGSGSKLHEWFKQALKESE